MRVLPILRALTAFFEGQDVVTAGYTLDGRHLANFSHLSFTAPVCCLFKVGGRTDGRHSSVASWWQDGSVPVSVDDVAQCFARMCFGILTKWMCQ